MGRGSWIALGILLATAGPGFGETIRGLGRNTDEAKEDARHVALQRLRDRLANHDPPLTAWKPTLADVESFLDGPAEAGAAVEEEGLGVQEQWFLRVRFPTEAELVLRDRRIRRQFGAAAAALAVTAGLAAWWTVACKSA
jgi:hypothetical protein